MPDAPQAPTKPPAISVMTASELPPDATLLGFDVGRRKLGVAVGQTVTATASPLEVLRCEDGEPDWGAVAALIERWRPALLVVGLPLTEQGANQPSTELARRFAKQLRRRFELPVCHVDEVNTSRQAAQRFAELRAAGAVRRRQGKQDDAVAAQLILERWLNDS